MSPTEIRFRRDEVWKGVVFVVVLLIVLIFILDSLPLIFWIIAAVLITMALIMVDRAYSPEPLVVLNDEGVFDRRLRVGVIRWEDISRIKLKSVSGVYYISLELHNKWIYQARRPLWLRVWIAWSRPFGLSPISINTTALDVDHDTLIEKLHEGCMESAQRTQIAERSRQ